jgi:hypothetical protein
LVRVWEVVWVEVLVTVGVVVCVVVLVTVCVVVAVRVFVGVCVLVTVRVLVRVWVSVDVIVPVAVWVPVPVCVPVNVCVLVFVSVLVTVSVRVTVSVLVTVLVAVVMSQWTPGAEQTPESWGQSSVELQAVTPSFEQYPCRQSTSDMQVRPQTLQRPWMPPFRQFIPLSQSTPASEALAKRPPGTPVMEPEVSSTISMLALCSWRSMTTSGFTRASDTGTKTHAHARARSSAPATNGRRLRARPPGLEAGSVMPVFTPTCIV